MNGQVNWRQSGVEPPRDREVHIVTDEGVVAPVSYSSDHAYYLGEDCWTRTDGEPGSWELGDIEAWADDYGDAEEAARQFVAEGRTNG